MGRAGATGRHDYALRAAGRPAAGTWRPLVPVAFTAAGFNEGSRCLSAAGVGTG
ncbi:hypothetical protein GZL_00124 [Streptomyces sp. 769]|nr:hypothetical protein GZL_00124 [Streptomyces sp. 769]